MRNWQAQPRGGARIVKRAYFRKMVSTIDIYQIGNILIRDHFMIGAFTSKRGSHSTEHVPGGAGKARFNVATPTYEARTRPLHVQHTYYRIIFKQNPFNIISRGVQR